MSNIDPTMDAFRHHDEQGLPLTVEIASANERGLKINLAAFACDALNALCPEDRVRRTLQEACADNGIPFNWTEFRLGMAALWTASGKPAGKDCFKIMKDFIVDTPNRMAPCHNT